MKMRQALLGHTHCMLTLLGKLVELPQKMSICNFGVNLFVILRQHSIQHSKSFVNAFTTIAANMRYTSPSRITGCVVLLLVVSCSRSARTLKVCEDSSVLQQWTLDEAGTLCAATCHRRIPQTSLPQTQSKPYPWMTHPCKLNQKAAIRPGNVFHTSCAVSIRVNRGRKGNASLCAILANEALCVVHPVVDLVRFVMMSVVTHALWYYATCVSLPSAKHRAQHGVPLPCACCPQLQILRSTICAECHQ